MFAGDVCIYLCVCVVQNAHHDAESVTCMLSANIGIMTSLYLCQILKQSQFAVDICVSEACLEGKDMEIASVETYEFQKKE